MYELKFMKFIRLVLPVFKILTIKLYCSGYTACFYIILILQLFKIYWLQFLLIKSCEKLNVLIY